MKTGDQQEKVAPSVLEFCEQVIAAAEHALENAKWLTGGDDRRMRALIEAAHKLAESHHEPDDIARAAVSTGGKRCEFTFAVQEMGRETWDRCALPDGHAEWHATLTPQGFLVRVPGMAKAVHRG